MSDIGAFPTLTIKRQLKGIADAVINDNVLLKKLKDGGRIFTGKGGDGFQFRVRSVGSTIGGSTTDWAEGGAQTTSPFVTMTGAYRPYAWRIMASKFQEERNKNAGAESKMADMIGEQLAEVKQQATNRFGAHMYGDGSTLSTGDATGSTPMSGLEDIIDDDNTYLNQARSGNTFWQAQIVSQASATFNLDSDSDGQANGLDAMFQLWNACSKGQASDTGTTSDTLAVNKDMPDHIITTDTGFRLYQKCLASQYRYTGDGADPEKTLTFHGAPIVWDSFCTASRFYFLNTKHLYVDVVGSNLLSVLVEQDIASPVAHIWVLGGQAQFYTRAPRYQGALRLT